MVRPGVNQVRNSVLTVQTQQTATSKDTDDTFAVAGSQVGIETRLREVTANELARESFQEVFPAPDPRREKKLKKQIFMLKALITFLGLSLIGLIAGFAAAGGF